ncbi:alkylated DNA repair protein AlkB homolog 8 isoform X1 [Tanacetum coccineum]
MSDLYDVNINVRSSVKLLPEIKGLLSIKPKRERGSLIRNVDTQQSLGELPSFVDCILEKVPVFQKLDEAADVSLDQLTVNEYPSGVGLSPHIDTHSAFQGSIYSLSLSGPCIMEFRRYSDMNACFGDKDVESCDNSSICLRKAIYLPPRSMLLLSGEGRYAWQHYIPHRKIDMVRDTIIRRVSRGVSFTFRKHLAFLQVRQVFVEYPLRLCKQRRLAHSDLSEQCSSSVVSEP